MKHFDQRWQMLAKKAGGLPEGDLPEQPPLGFATRVLARSRETPQESWEDVMNALGLRAVLIAAGLCVISAGFAFSDWYESRIERPTMEQSVTNELSWP